MPEALAIVAVFAVAVAAWVGALLHARDPRNHSPVIERARLRDQQAMLHERLNLARQERWSPEMIESLSDQLAEVSSQLHRHTNSSAVPVAAENQV